EIDRVSDMTVYGPEFYFDGMAVGLFLESDGPRIPGRYRYEPYRGPGHFDMQTICRAGGLPRCYYDIAAERVSFAVIDCPDYGVLQLGTFESTAGSPGCSQPGSRSDER